MEHEINNIREELLNASSILYYEFDAPKEDPVGTAFTIGLALGLERSLEILDGAAPWEYEEIEMAFTERVVGQGVGR